MRKEQANVVDLKNKILEVSYQVFSTYGYSGTSLNDITNRLNITRTPIYYHFNNKKNLYLATAHWRLDKRFNVYKEVWEADMPLLERIRKDLMTCMTTGVKETTFFQESMTRVELSDVKQAYNEASMDVFKLKYEHLSKAKKEGQLEKYVDVIYLLRNMYMAYYGILKLLEYSVESLRLDATGGELESFIDELVTKYFAQYIVE